MWLAIRIVSRDPTRARSACTVANALQAEQGSAEGSSLEGNVNSWMTLLVSQDGSSSARVFSLEANLVFYFHFAEMALGLFVEICA